MKWRWSLWLIIIDRRGEEEENMDDDCDDGQQYLNERIRLLRSMLEWGSELRNGDDDDDDDERGIPSLSSSEKNNNNLSPLSSISSSSSTVPKTQQFPSSITTNKEVMVLVWPGGRILRLPRGTTAGDAVKRLKPSTGYKTTRKSRNSSSAVTQQQQHVVNVNNRFVSGDTPLVDGDYIVLSKEKVKV